MNSTHASGVLRTIGRQSAYGLAAFPISIAGFVLIVTLGAMGVGMAITVVGLPILVLMLLVARGFAIGERQLLRVLMDLEPPQPRYRKTSSGGWFSKVLSRLADPQAWLDAAFQIVRLPLGIASFTINVVWWAGAIGGLTYVLWGWSIPRGPDDRNLAELIGLGDRYVVEVIFYFIIGAAFALTMRWAVAVAAWIHAGPALLLLCGRAAIQEEVELARADRDAATASRDAGRTAESSALRRLERDIHDGPQQQLVRLSMDLGRARKQLESDPERARAILDEAITRSTDTLDELRALSRGIAPPLLVDRGLRAALEEITARAPIPVYLEYGVSDELPDYVETGAYFVVSECLTNIAKHAQAQFASVRLDLEPTVTGRELVVAVTDDGIGGAHRAKGSGLTGLDERMRSLGGMLDILSPAGGPSVIEARIPCG